MRKNYKLNKIKEQKNSTISKLKRYLNNRNRYSYFKKGYKLLIRHYKLEDLKSLETLHLYVPLKEDEIKNLKYLNDECEIILHIDTYPQLLDIKNELITNNKLNKITVVVTPNVKVKFNEFIFSNSIPVKNIFIEYSEEESISLKEYLMYESKLYNFVRPALNLSPFERYIYAYNFVKTFKNYKENEENKNDSRDLYKILDNEFIVCVGYAKLFSDLLNKLGINNMRIHVDVDRSYEDISSDQELDKDEVPFILPKGGHARLLVNIKDKKYNIDGFYISDPTWDNDQEVDYYNHLALTSTEFNKSKLYNYVSKIYIYELFDVKDIEEFYEKIMFLLNRRDSVKELNEIIKSIAKLLYRIDPLYMSDLNEKVEGKDLNGLDLLHHLGLHITKHTNKVISGETIIKAVSNVYINGYGISEEEVNQLLPKILEQNKDRHDHFFPPRYKIDKDGNKINISDENKFDINIKNIKIK